MNNYPRVLIIEDTKPLALAYEAYLSKEPYQVDLAFDGAQASFLVKQTQYDCILLDLQLPDIDGSELMKQFQESGIDTPIIAMTAFGSVDIAVELLRSGAVDFLEKPFSATRLVTTLKNNLKIIKYKKTFVELEQKFDGSGFEGFIGKSVPMQLVYKIITNAASSKASVFITGESGTGKEVCAEALHKRSDRANKPFVAINCGAIPESLMESEIFGHVKGAFTGAMSARDGAATAAHGGTLFLDELGEMNLDLQKKLLRFLQTGKFKKVGSNKEEQVDIRIISATNRDPLKEVGLGNLREDLYYRLHVIPIHMPPLKERMNDIILLADYFLQKYTETERKSFKGFSEVVKELFLDYSWPGNVRQLQNVIMNIVVLNDGEMVETEHLPHPLNQLVNTERKESSVIDESSMTELPGYPEVKKFLAADTVVPLAELEKQAILNAIQVSNDSIPKAASLLGVSPSTIYRKMQAWEDSPSA
jgi:two-component system repressor protein LuxO